jgi:hypothetical protein
MGHKDLAKEANFSVFPEETFDNVPPGNQRRVTVTGYGMASKL